MIHIEKMKAKPSVSAQQVADDILAGKVVESVPTEQTYELEFKIIANMTEVRELVEFIKSKAVKTPAAEKTV